jgi:translation initiation factor 2 alpha subunit (eIF-2alpha)
MPETIRYYRKPLPTIQDIIVAKLTSIPKKSGIYAECIDYPELKLFIPPTEISRRKVNLQNFFSQDKLYPVLTLGVDEGKKLVDVSYSKINEKDRKEHMEKFAIYQKIYKLGLEASSAYSIFSGIDMDLATETIFDISVWDIFDKFTEDSEASGKVNDFYLSILEDPSLLFNKSKGVDIPDFDEYKSKFIESIKNKIKICDLTLSAVVTLICLQDGAVNRIKSCLKSDLNQKVQIRYIGSPRYEVIASGSDRTLAEGAINTAISTIRANCEKYGVEFGECSKVCIQKDKQYTFH